MMLNFKRKWQACGNEYSKILSDLLLYLAQIKRFRTSLIANIELHLSTQYRAVRRGLTLFERSEFRQLSRGGTVLGA